MKRVPPPSQLFVEVTSNCSLACPHCYVEAGVGRLRQLAFETVVGAIEEFRAMGGVRFTLSGGEPTLHKRWIDILTAAHSAGLCTEIITNGTRLLDRDLDYLASNPVMVDVSLEAATAARHDAIRGPGTFAATVDTIERLIERGLGSRMTICFSPMRANWDELEPLFDWAEMVGIGRVYVSLLENRGRAATQSVDFGLDTTQKQALIGTIVSIMARQTTTLLETPNLRYFPERFLGSSASVESIDRTLRMTADGDLYLTAYLDAVPFQLGKYRAGNLASAWTNQKVAAALLTCRSRNALIPACRSCTIYELCQCGSAMFAWSAERGFFDVDSYCAAKRNFVSASIANVKYEEHMFQRFA